jgi:hypothetical protein
VVVPPVVSILSHRDRPATSFADLFQCHWPEVPLERITAELRRFVDMAGSEALGSRMKVIACSQKLVSVYMQKCRFGIDRLRLGSRSPNADAILRRDQLGVAAFVGSIVMTIDFDTG